MGWGVVLGRLSCTCSLWNVSCPRELFPALSSDGCLAIRGVPSPWPTPGWSIHTLSELEKTPEQWHSSMAMGRYRCFYVSVRCRPGSLRVNGINNASVLRLSLVIFLIENKQFPNIYIYSRNSVIDFGIQY